MNVKVALNVKIYHLTLPYLSYAIFTVKVVRITPNRDKKYGKGF